MLAGSDEATDFLARARDELRPALRTFEGQDDVHLPLMDKPRSHELAEAAGVRAPWTALIETADDLERAIDAAPYPSVLKPVLSHLWRPCFGQERVLLAHGPDELRAHARPRARRRAGRRSSPSTSPAATTTSRRRSSCAPRDGSFPMQFGCRKIRQSPARVRRGVAVRVGRAARVAGAGARKLLSHTGYVGVAGVETKRHADTGEYYFIEANVRLPTQFGLGDAAGVEASWRTYATLAGLKLGPQPPQRDGVQLVFPELDMKEVRRHMRGERAADRPATWAGWARSWAGTREFGVLDLRDPGPFAALVGASLKRRFGK